jgi:predicted deacylase
LPTPAVLSQPAAVEPPNRRPTQTPRPVDHVETTSPSPTPPPPTAAAALTGTANPTSTESIPSTATGTPVATLAPLGNAFIVGQSAQGRDIIGWSFGAGPHTLLVVGGIHAGFESNTVLLVNELVAHFQAAPASLLPGMRLILIPVANPDGLVLGRQTAGRFNANGVDLNRNWGCEWSEEAYWQDRRVDPGPRAFSEPETQALARLIRETQPAAAIFYHSAANGIFTGDCPAGGVSDELARVLGEASGYAYGQPFSAYRVTGTAASWVDGQGIPAVDLELTGTRDTEFVRNLRAIQAAQCWITGAC